MASGKSKATAKMVATDRSVAAFIRAIENPVRRVDAEALVKMLARITGQPPCLWGASIIGFGSYHYRYASGREGDAPLAGFSPRKTSLVVYLLMSFASADELLKRLGRHTTGKSCLYIKKLADIDLAVLDLLMTASVATMREKYPP